MSAARKMTRTVYFKRLPLLRQRHQENSVASIPNNEQNSKKQIDPLKSQPSSQPVAFLFPSGVRAIPNSETLPPLLELDFITRAMRSPSKMRSSPLFFVIWSLLFISRTTQLQPSGEGSISILVSDKGLDFAKDVLISRAINSIIPLQLPRIAKTVKIPVLGEVDVVLSDISIDSVGIGSSYVKTGETGIVLIASGATANLSMNWDYSYHPWPIPVSVSDEGSAAVKVKGMEVGLTLTLMDQEGALKLSVLDCGCSVKAISIKLEGGSSWLYQVIIDTLHGQIVSAVEEAIPKRLREEVTKLDSLLQDLPRKIPVGDVAALNVTFVNDPVPSNSSIAFRIDGLFTAADDILDSYNRLIKRWTQNSTPCPGGAAEMVQISLHENVLKSASLVYFNANYMNWIIDKLPDQSLLNTAGWKYIVPRLYRQYPNDDMKLNISVSSPPIVQVSKEGIDTTIYADVVIGVVVDSGEIIQVACISLVIDASGSAQILRNNLAGIIKLDSLNVSLKWSTIGNLHLGLVQPLISMVLKTVVVPSVNLHLMKGFPLPLIHGITLEKARIFYTGSRTTLVCSDLMYEEHIAASLL